jgi:outer membrane protein assembly factor BamB
VHVQVTSGIVLDEDSDSVYFGSYDGNCYSINTTTGVARWNYSIEAPVSRHLQTTQANPPNN